MFMKRSKVYNKDEHNVKVKRINLLISHYAIYVMILKKLPAVSCVKYRV
jgi:hypothetical protein